MGEQTATPTVDFSLGASIEEVAWIFMKWVEHGRATFRVGDHAIEWCERLIAFELIEGQGGAYRISERAANHLSSFALIKAKPNPEAKGGN